MPVIIYVEHNGTEHPVSVAPGQNLMQAAVEHAIPGIEGDCGGLCACGTCHVYLPEDLAVLVDGPDELEQGMIEFAFDVNDSSRLSCQLIADDAMDGKRVLMPKRQY